ncbi:hypothetical protein FACS189430_10440 [Bacteroidia bacterium]|nr:hypothetical protein FACS189430_10440 [Bacteroidia bacterium]
MKKVKLQIILVGMVAWMMSSCNEDVYDNIKEMVDSETVYPAGYDLLYVKASGGMERVEIDLCESRVPESELFLPRAVRTVVEYGGKRDVFEPARSWVNITGLTVPQLYRFKIYTEDEWGDRSKPVEITGKPFTEADKNAYVILPTATAFASRAVVNCPTSPNLLYRYHSVKYSYTDKDGVVQSGESLTPNFTITKLANGQTTQLNLSYHLLIPGVIDTVVINDVLAIKTLLVDVPINVVLNKPVTHSDLTGGYPGAGAVDGVKVGNATRWVSADNTNAHWIEIDLQGTFSINELRLWRESNAAQQMPMFSLQVPDGVGSWMDVVTETTNTELTYSTTFVSVTTDKVRWYVPSYPNNRVRLFEIEVYGIIAD